MEKVLSIREFITESETYPYSKSFFDLLKLESEVTLMERFLGIHDYVKEAGEGLSKIVETGYLMESVTDDTLAGMEKTYQEKATLLYESVGKRFDQIIAAIKAFFRSLMAKFRSTQKKCEEALTLLKGKTLTDDDRSAIKSIVDDALKSSGLTIQTTGNSSAGIPNNALPSGAGYLGNALAAAIANNTVTITLSSEDQKKALSEADLKSVVDNIAAGNLKAARTTVNKDSRSIVIPSNSEEILKLANHLDQVKIDVKHGEGLKRNKDHLTTDPDRAPLTSEFQQAIAHTMKVYVSVEKFRLGVATGILKRIKPDKANKEDAAGSGKAEEKQD